MFNSKAIFFVILVLFSSCNNQSKSNVVSPGPKSPSPEAQVGKNGLSSTKAIIKTAYGNIVFKFYPKKAPNTVKRIQELIKQGFYDGIVFHRVVKKFVVQGGDPTGTGRSGSGVPLKAEFNSLQHVKGTVAMARAQDPDSADSQFYIAMDRLEHLDGSYTVFGQVVEGYENVEKIKQGDKMLSVSLSE